MSELSARARLASEAQPLPRIAAQLYWLSIPPKSRSRTSDVNGRFDSLRHPSTSMMAAGTSRSQFPVCPFRDNSKLSHVLLRII